MSRIPGTSNAECINAGFTNVILHLDIQKTIHNPGQIQTRQ